MYPAADPAAQYAKYEPGLLPGILPRPIATDRDQLARQFDAIDGGQPAAERVPRSKTLPSSTARTWRRGEQ